LNGEIDAFQDMELVEPLMHVTADDDLLRIAGFGHEVSVYRFPTPRASSTRRLP
jgi:hypothetical protein